MVPDYRGYGWSGGEPCLSSLLADAEPLLDSHTLGAAMQWAGVEPEARPVVLFGRSLGSNVATHLAAIAPRGCFAGLILESGIASASAMLSRGAAGALSLAAAGSAGPATAPLAPGGGGRIGILENELKMREARRAAEPLPPLPLSSFCVCPAAGDHTHTRPARHRRHRRAARARQGASRRERRAEEAPSSPARPRPQ